MNDAESSYRSPTGFSSSSSINKSCLIVGFQREFEFCILTFELGIEGSKIFLTLRTSFFILNFEFGKSGRI